MDNTTERIVLITGANRGIGFETAQQLARGDFMSSSLRGTRRADNRRPAPSSLPRDSQRSFRST